MKLNYNDFRYLSTEEEFRNYISKAFENKNFDEETAAHAIAKVIMARSFAQIAEEAGVNLNDLYDQLTRHGVPEIGLWNKVLRAMGMEIKFS